MVAKTRETHMTASVSESLGSIICSESRLIAELRWVMDINVVALVAGSCWRGAMVVNQVGNQSKE
jgi:hypothetical protein